MAVATLLAVVGSLLSAATAAATRSGRPGAPTNVQATSTAGTPGVTVTWDAPTSDGGSPVVFYLASNYSGTHTCVVVVPVANSCSLSGIKNGSVRHAIRVRAFNVVGAGLAAAAFSVVSTSTAGGGGPTSGSTGSDQGGSSPSGTAASGTTGQPTSSSGVGATETAASSGGSTDTSTGGATAELPFTGVNLTTIFVIGSGLVLTGRELLRPVGYRRRARLGRLGGLSRWFFGL